MQGIVLNAVNEYKLNSDIYSALKFTVLWKS